MPPRFMYLKNMGSPTRWDVDPYLHYLKGVRATLPSDLQDLTTPDRFHLPSMSARSMWHTGFSEIQVQMASIFLAARNDHETRRFEFRYSGVLKVQTSYQCLRAMPSIVVQELVRLRNGVLRHSFAHLGGDVTTIHASSIAFSDRPLN